MTAPRPERCWLLTCLNALGRREPPPAAPPDLDWDSVLAEADTEDLLPALSAAVAASEGPALVRRRVSEALTAARARHLIMTRALAAVLTRFEADRIAALPLKGPALAETVYPDPSLRAFADLDVLVPPEDRRRADAALQALGYQRLADAHSWEFDIEYDGATLYAGRDGVHVDLHWALVTEPRYVWSGEAERAVWQRAVALMLAGRRTLGLAREDLVLYLATHLAVHHALAGLRHHWDVALVLGSGPLDWDTLLTRAGEWRVRRPLYFVLRGVEEAFGPLVPPAVLTSLAPPGPRAALLRALLRDERPERRARLEYLVTLLLVDRGRDVCRSLGEALVPPADWLRARYGSAAASRPALYWAHARRLGTVLGSLRH